MSLKAIRTGSVYNGDDATIKDMVPGTRDHNSKEDIRTFPRESTERLRQPDIHI